MIILGALLVLIVFKLYSIDDKLGQRFDDASRKSNHTQKIYSELAPHIGRDVNIVISDDYPVDYNEYSLVGEMNMTLLGLDRNFAQFSYLVKKKETIILLRLSYIASLKNVEVKGYNENESL